MFTHIGTKLYDRKQRRKFSDNNNNNSTDNTTPTPTNNNTAMAKSKDTFEDAASQRMSTLEMNLDNLYRRLYVLDTRVNELESNLNATGYWYSFRGSLRWVTRQVVLMILPMIILGAILLYMNGGPGGQNFEDRTTEPLMPESAVEVIASLPSPPGNLAVTHNSEPPRLFFTFHPEYDYADMKVAEYNMQTNKYNAYPNKAWQAVFKSVLSLRIDHKNNILYALDFAHYGFGTLSDPIAGIALTKRIYGLPKLFGFSLQNNSLVHEFEFTEVAGIGSMLNDFAISPSGEYIYIADTSIFRGSPSLVVYHVPTRTARRVLDAHASMFAEKYTPRVEGSGPVVSHRMFVVRPHVDSITVSIDGKYLYYAPLSHEYLYRIRTNILHNDKATEKELDRAVEIYSKKSMSDGIAMDKYDNIYLTDIEHNCINVIKPDKSLSTLIASPSLLRWPDGLSLDSDQQYLYISASALHLKFRGENMSKFAPYHILRVKLDKNVMQEDSNRQARTTEPSQQNRANEVPSYKPQNTNNDSNDDENRRGNDRKPSRRSQSTQTDKSNDDRPTPTDDENNSSYQNIYGEL